MPASDPSSRHKHTGVCAAARAATIAGLIDSSPAPVWIIVSEELKTAETLAEDIAFFYRAIAPKGAPTSSVGAGLPAIDAFVFPESIPDSRDMREAFAASSDRLTVLSRLRGLRNVVAAVGDRGEPASARPASAALLIATTPEALLQPVPALEAFTTTEIVLKKGQKQSFTGLLEKLQQLDYDSEAVCEAPGHYAIRGGIIDVYPVTANHPYRLDFFGDEIEEIRGFDPVSQRSGEPVDSITLVTSPRVRLDLSSTGIADYLSPATHLVFIEPAALESGLALAGSSGERERADVGSLTLAATYKVLERSAAAFGIMDIDEASVLFDSASDEVTWDSEGLVHHRDYPGDALIAQERLQFEDEARARFLKRVAGWSREGFELRFVVARETEETRASEVLATEPALATLKPRFLHGALNEGFKIRFRDNASLNLVGAPLAATSRSATSADPTGLVVITETEIYGRRRSRRGLPSHKSIAQRAQVDQLLDFSELVEGDFVVHLQHGIALYRGLTKLDTTQGLREVISLEFDDHVTLHVPLTESHLISRYVGLSKTRPQLGRIGSGRWEKARQAAERATVDLAAELLRIQAAREAEQGQSFPADTDWQREFETSFPFTETPDQLKAITETKADLERARPMDRLICGDVGFGKTEVAIRAAFKVAQAGKQVALLVPTTVLAQQHLNTFRERMAGYPVAIEMVSRFRTRAEQKRILDATAAGQVDILIGTHRLLQADVHFKDLGLVVIDEEQRFGVRHKEVFKRMRATVDVLSLSATPIPRTLYLALTGARDMSVIETPPVDRHPIQTIVRTYDEKLVVEAIRREVKRGGQVFYLHNRVNTIDLVATRLRQLLPDLNIGIGHGKMDEADLERTMTEFVAGGFHVLVCTTIIESGLDLPNCNTIIIEGADRFGLSQLYQLRGRVGRFKHQAYAYLLLHRHSQVLEVARQRLSALRAHNQLGAGFRIAMRDLELRGAGNLLGAEQSGHIVGVGFELYCQLLRQSVARLKGDKQAAYLRASVRLDFVQARLPQDYIGETRLRIDFYRRLALAGSTQQLKSIEAELRDRFGKFGDEVRALLLVTEIRIRAEQKGLASVETEGNRLKCLRQGSDRDNWVQVGAKFPRLTAPKPLLRLREILAFLNNFQ